jgi:hypothetical protein
MASTFWARIDSASANNPALNLTGDPAVGITFVPSGTSGDLILDTAGGAIDPDTQIEIEGIVYDFTFELSGLMPTTKNNGSQQVPDQFEGNAVYIVTVQDYPTAGETTRLAVLPDDLATQAEMDSFGNGAIDVQNVDTTSSGAVCFAAGTQILTPKGCLLIEDLKAGDLVMTLDHGPQPILWISQSEHVWPGSSEKDLPILISSGALGPNTPRTDLMVSPQHKILILDANTANASNNDEVLVPAKGLTSLPGVRVMKGKSQVTYYNILLERHEILLAHGLTTESFFPGPAALKMLQAKQREVIFSLFPSLKECRADGYWPQARSCLTRRETEKLIKPHGVSWVNLLAARQGAETQMAS